MPKKNKARRVTLYLDEAGEYRYRVQGHNWRTIEASEQGFKRKTTVARRIALKYPKVEVVDLTAA